MKRPLHSRGLNILRKISLRGVHDAYPPRSNCRHHSHEGYIEEWFSDIIKPGDFYANHAEGRIRRYFYNIDLQGRLFLEETSPKKITTSIKDQKFLNFFFQRIQLPRLEDMHFLAENGIQEDYPYVSLCGQEVNYVRPAATPIVFHTFHDDNLFYGGDLAHTFHPTHLAVSPTSGKLYHRLIPESTDARKSHNHHADLGYGLVRSSIAVSIAEHIEPDDHGGLLYANDKQSQKIAWLPSEFEPGPWASTNSKKL